MRDFISGDGHGSHEYSSRMLYTGPNKVCAWEMGGGHWCGGPLGTHIDYDV